MQKFPKRISKGQISILRDLQKYHNRQRDLSNGVCKSTEARVHPKKLAPTLANGSNAGEPIEICEETVVNDPKTPPIPTPRQPKREMSRNVIGEVVPEVDEGLESFTIVVNGLIIGSDLSMSVKTKYYKLCSSQNTPLHTKLL